MRLLVLCLPATLLLRAMVSRQTRGTCVALASRGIGGMHTRCTQRFAHISTLSSSSYQGLQSSY